MLQVCGKMVVHTLVNSSLNVLGGVNLLAFVAVVVGVAVDVKFRGSVDCCCERCWFAVLLGVDVGAGGFNE